MLHAQVAVAALAAASAALPAFAQALEVPVVEIPAIPARAASAQGFVPDGWRLEHAVAGRLDDNAQPDLLLLLRMDDPTNVVAHDGLGVSPFDTNPRMLVFAFADAGGGYRRALVDHALIPRAESSVLDDVLQDDPANALRIATNRAVSITLHSWASAGSWSTHDRTFTVRWQDGCFRLIGFDRAGLHRGSGETDAMSVNYLTGRAWTRGGSIEDDAPGPTRPTRLRDRTPICLDAIGDGFAFEPALAP